MGKACWPCKDRKIRCDLAKPRCSNCRNRGVSCQYGLKLSWPRQGDARRHQVLQLNNNPHDQWPVASETHFIGVESSDVALHNAISWSSTPVLRNHSLRLSGWYQEPRSVPQALSWIPSDNDTFNEKLISYYSRPSGVVLLSANDDHFRGLLLSMSFTDSSSASVAVRQAVYALTALDVYGLEGAMPYRGKALRALIESYKVQDTLGVKDRLQHVAAGLLLGLFEMNNTSQSRLEWSVHVCNAKKAANHVFPSDRRSEGDPRILLDWIFYHDALSRFSTSHWLRRTEGMEACMNDDKLRRVVQLCGDEDQISPILGCSPEVLESITAICDYAHDDPADDQNSHAEAVARLERRLTHAKQYLSFNQSIPVDDPSIQKIAELYRVAGLIYLYRACLDLPSTQSSLQSLIATAFEILASLDKCSRSFPLVIIGCEARTDDDRFLVLDILRRSLEGRRMANLEAARDFIEGFWAMLDLDSKAEVGYVQKFEAVMGRGKRMLPFV